MKCHVCRMEERAWLAPTSSDSVELLVLIFCLLEKLIAASFPIDIIAPVCPRQSLCTTWDNQPTSKLLLGCPRRDLVSCGMFHEGT
jgi:hypothetical protein